MSSQYFSVRKESLAQKNAARYEIDAKRIGVNFYDKDALPRSREFIRLDSTYYVGWYYEGMYKYDRAADYLGYKNCIAPLKKSLFLFERNYNNNLKNFLQRAITPWHKLTSCGFAMHCTTVIPMWKNLIVLCGFCKEYKTGIQEMILWNTISKRHGPYIATVFIFINIPFLKNSVDENEQLALSHLYTALAGGDGNAVFYLAIIHNYLLNIDSAGLYYDILKQTGGFSYNNYAHFQNTLGNFAEAIADFQNEKYAFDKRLIESYYFLPTLFINSGKSKEAIDETNGIINQMGSTPGFGWYNIALGQKLSLQWPARQL